MLIPNEKQNKPLSSINVTEHEDLSMPITLNQGEDSPRTLETDNQKEPMGQIELEQSVIGRHRGRGRTK